MENIKPTDTKKENFAKFIIILAVIAIFIPLGYATLTNAEKEQIPQTKQQIYEIAVSNYETMANETFNSFVTLKQQELELAKFKMNEAVKKEDTREMQRLTSKIENLKEEITKLKNGQYKIVF